MVDLFGCDLAAGGLLPEVLTCDVVWGYVMFCVTVDCVFLLI